MEDMKISTLVLRRRGRIVGESFSKGRAFRFVHMVGGVQIQTIGGPAAFLIFFIAREEHLPLQDER